MSHLQTRQYMLQSERGQSPEALGKTVAIKATSEQTGGVFNLFEFSCQPGEATPLLVHYAEDVAIYVLEGRLAIFWGTERKEATTGSFFYQPRGTPHGFRVEGDTTARILYFTMPAGFDGFMKEHQLKTAGKEREMAAARYKIEVLGPLPE
jgi:quercetin dioxygenase-like cupin family protein